MLSSWEYIKKGMLHEAISSATEEYNDTNSLVSIRHRATASMMMNNYEAALNDYLMILNETEDRHKGDTDYIDVGVAYWLLGYYEKAVKMFMDSMILKLPYTSNIVIPSALVYFISVYFQDEKMKRESIKYLKRHSKRKVPLALFLLNEINYNELLETIGEDSPLRSRYLCKYEVYIAVKHLENGDKSGFYDHLQNSVNTNEVIEFEYFIALSELNKRARS